MSHRSHWGWGFADRFPDQAGADALGQQLVGVLGFAGSAGSRRPVPLDAVQIGPCRVTIPAALSGWITDGAEARIRHTYGRSYPDQVRGFGGDFKNAPDVVAFPTHPEQVEATLSWALGARLAVVPYGGGTSVVGGVECASDGPWQGVLCLDLTGLKAIHAVDPVSGLAHLGAGLLGPELEAGLRPHGLTLRHFPQSFEFSTLGGWIATRAGGHFATRYTHIDDLVAGLRMLTPGAGVYETIPLPGSGAGPCPDRLAIGSEGSLGVITDAWVRVRPKPQWRASASVSFDSFDRAVEATRGVAQSGLAPSNCRLLDRREAALNGVVADGSCVLLLGFESAVSPVDAQLKQATALALGHGGRLVRPPTVVGPDGTSRRDSTAGAWRSAFLNGPYLQSTLISLGLLVDTFETACTWRAFPDLHADLVSGLRGLMKRLSGHARLSCRFTHVYPDGPAPYYTFICPCPPGAELTWWREIKALASDTLMAHGATITHHHAVGRVHQPWHAKQMPAPFLKALEATKGVFDPTGLMNPGALLPVSVSA